MIERLFASRTLYSTMAMFFDFPDEALESRVVGRAIGRDVKCVQRQLERLAECGVVVCRIRGRTRVYRISDRCPMRKEFEALFRESRELRYYPLQDGPRRAVEDWEESLMWELTEGGDAVP